MAGPEVRRIGPDQRVATDQSSGFVREEAVTAGLLWSGMVFTGPGQSSGWHHHGACQSSIYVVSGSLRLEFGPGGRESVEAGPGDFVHVPAGVVHRESNPGAVESELVVARAGSGPPTINVAGPDA